MQFKGENSGLKAGSISVKNKNDLLVNARNVAIGSLFIDDKLQQISVNGIQWQQADIHFLLQPGKGAGGSGSFRLRDIAGANTKIEASNASQKMSVFLKTVSADALTLLKGQPLQVTGLAASGNDLSITDKNLQVTVKSLNLADRRSSVFKDVFYTSHTGRDSVRVTIASLGLIPDINALIRGKIQADAVTVFQPVATISLSAAAPDSMATAKAFPGITIGKLVVQQPFIQFISTNEKGNAELEWKGNQSSNSFELTNLKVNSGPARHMSADLLRLSMDHFRYMNAKGKTFDAGNGQLAVSVGQLEMQQDKTGSWDWQGIVNNLAARNFIIDSLGKKGGTLTIASAQLNDLSISSALLSDMRALVSNNTRFNLQEVTGSYHDADKWFDWYNAGYDKKTKYFSADSFSYRPALDKESFLKAQTFQADYMTIQTGRLGIGPFDIQRYIRDTILDLGVVQINDGYLATYRDKRLPRPPGVVRPLPVNMVKQIATHLEIDTLRVSNALVDYEEVNEKTGSEGKITVNRLNATVTRLRNFNIKETDSLHITASAYLQNSILTKLQLRESYTDTLGGFLMTAQMGAADLTVLNPVLIPLASAELKSGILDTMTLRVAGREYLAFGEMSMYYHDLKVRVVKPGKNRQSFLTGIVTFLANTIIKNENKDRTGTVFFQRLRDRSAINYLVKITLSGVTSSIGVKKNKKLIRKYRQEIKARKLPPIINPN